MSTLTDVAKESKVSLATVSRVLNKVSGSVPISKNTRERVMEVAKRLGYAPNAAAQALRKGKSKTISVLGSSPNFFSINPSNPNNFHMEATAGLIRAAVEKKYHVTFLTGSESHQKEGGILTDIGFADGLLVLNRDLAIEDDYVSALKSLPKPIVYALDYPGGDDVYSVAPDDIGGGEYAVAKLNEMGHTKIGFVRKNYYSRIFDKREQGWRQGLQKLGIEANWEWVKNAEEVSEAYVAQHNFTALLCSNDQSALDSQRRLSSMDPRPGIAAFGFKREGAAGHHGILNFAEPLADIVGAGVEMLIDLIEKKSIPDKQKRFPFELINKV